MTLVNDAVLITRSAPEVFSVLTRWDLYPEWNPYIPRIQGKPAAGEAIRVTFAMGLGPALTLNCRMEVCDSQRLTLAWEYRAFLPWLYTARHSFVLEKTGPQHCRLVQTEAMQGLLASRFFTFYHKILQKRFQLMHDALRLRLEK